jgi:hypothetical protein
VSTSKASQQSIYGIVHLTIVCLGVGLGRI